MHLGVILAISIKVFPVLKKNISSDESLAKFIVFYVVFY